MEAAGIEPASFGNTSSEIRGDAAQTAAHDADLSAILDAWPILPPGARAKLAKVARQAAKRANTSPADPILSQEVGASD